MKKGILLTDDSELYLPNGKMVIGDASLQNQRVLLGSCKGDLKNAALSGVGANAFIEDNDSDAFAGEIRKQFARDGMKVKSINIQIPTVAIKADYV